MSALKQSSKTNRCDCCPYGFHIDVDFVMYCESLLSTLYGKRHTMATSTPMPNGTTSLNRDISLYGKKRISSPASFTLSSPSTTHDDSLLSTRRSSEGSAESSFKPQFRSFRYPPKQRPFDISKDKNFNEAVAEFEEVVKEHERSSSKLSLNSNESFALNSPPPLVSRCQSVPPTSVSSHMTHQNGFDRQLPLEIREKWALTLRRARELEELVRQLPLLKQKVALLKRSRNQNKKSTSNQFNESLNSPQNKARLNELERSGLITPSLSRRRKLLFTSPSDNEYESSDNEIDTKGVNIVSTRNIDLIDKRSTLDWIGKTKTERRSIERQDSSTQTEMKNNCVNSTTQTEIERSPYHTLTTLRRLERSLDICSQQSLSIESKRTDLKSVGVMVNLAPSLPKKNSSMVTDLRLEDCVDMRDIIKSKSMTKSKLVQCSLYDSGMEESRKSSLESSILNEKIDVETQASEKCRHCELRQTETVGVGSCDLTAIDIGINTHDAGVDPMNQSGISLQSVKFCDKCHQTVSERDEGDTKDKTPSPVTPGGSKIPRLSGSPGITGSPSIKINVANKTIIEERNDEFLVYRNPNEGIVSRKHRSNFPSMLTPQIEISKLRLLDEVCKITESESDSSLTGDGSSKFDNSTIDEMAKIKSEPSDKMKAALKVLNDSLLKPHLANNSTKLKSLQVISKEWFQVSSCPDSDSSVVEDYLDCFERYSKHLLNEIVNMADESGNTAMHYAISHSNFDVVSVLLDSKVCDVNKLNDAGYPAIMMVSLATVADSTQKEVIKKLFEIGDVNIRAKANGQTALMLAASHGLVETCRLLLEAGAAINAQDKDGSTALMCAAEHGYTEVAKLLLSHVECDVIIADNDNATATSIALDYGRNDIAMLLSKSANMISRGSLPYSSLKRNQSKAMNPDLKRTGSFNSPNSPSFKRNFSGNTPPPIPARPAGLILKKFPSRQ